MKEDIKRSLVEVETLYNYLRRVNAKAGDEFLINGGELTLVRYAPRAGFTIGCHSAWPYYLRGADGLTISGKTLLVVSIPGIKGKPSSVTSYRWVVKFADSLAPHVTERWYPDEGQVRAVYTRRNVEWVTRLDKCSRVDTIECDC